MCFVNDHSLLSRNNLLLLTDLGWKRVVILKKILFQGSAGRQKVRVKVHFHVAIRWHTRHYAPYHQHDDPVSFIETIINTLFNLQLTKENKSSINILKCMQKKTNTKECECPRYAQRNEHDPPKWESRTGQREGDVRGWEKKLFWHQF